MPGGRFRRWIQQVVSQENVRKIHVRRNTASEGFGFRIGILSRLHIPVYRIGPTHRAEAQDGDQDDQNAETDEKSRAEAFSFERLHSFSPEAVVLATEHELSMQLVPELIKEYRVIDMSGAFRLKESREYQEWYGFEHTAPQILKEAVYGLPE